MTNDNETLDSFNARQALVELSTISALDRPAQEAKFRDLALSMYTGSGDLEKARATILLLAIHAGIKALAKSSDLEPENLYRVMQEANEDESSKIFARLMASLNFPSFSTYPL